MSKNTEKQIKMVKIDQLIPYASNARAHSDEQVAQIAASIREFGFNVPILVDRDNGVIAGHGRLLAARKLELAEVPVIELAHLTNTQKRAFILADNKLHDNSSFDYEVLQVELEALKDADFDMNLIGFEGFELDTIGDDLNLDLELGNGSDFGNEDLGEGVADPLKLIIGGKKLPITQQEHDQLLAKHKEHVDNVGVDFGFVTWLLQDG